MERLENAIVPNEQVHFSSSNIQLYIDNELEGEGVLYLSDRLLWIKVNGSGISVEHPNIGVLALSKMQQDFQYEHVLLMIDQENQPDAEQDSASITMRIVSVGDINVDQLYEAIHNWFSERNALLNQLEALVLDYQNGVELGVGGIENSESDEEIFPEEGNIPGFMNGDYEEGQFDDA